jgi:hypothetical protein
LQSLYVFPCTGGPEAFITLKTTEKKEAGGMTMKQMSVEYRRSAELLKKRIRELTPLISKENLNETEKALIRSRLVTLNSMLTDTLAIAVLTERYYERGYRRSARYTI